MVICVLDSYPSEVHGAKAIVNHLLSRISELVSFERLADKVQLWIDSAESGAINPASIGAKVGDRDRALKMLEAALVADHDDEQSVTLTAWMMMTLQERRICLVGSREVQFRQGSMANSFEIMIPGVSEPMYRISGEPTLQEQDGELTLAASSDGCGFVVLLRIQQSVTVLSSFGKFDESDLKIAKRHVANRPTTLSLHEEFRENLDNSSVATVWRHVESQVVGAMTHLFGPLTTLNANDTDWPRAFEGLKKGGIFGMLNRDGELTRALAAIGLVNTFSTAVGTVRLIGKVLDVDEDALEEAINLAPHCGLPLVARKGESVVALV